MGGQDKLNLGEKSQQLRQQFVLQVRVQMCVNFVNENNSLDFVQSDALIKIGSVGVPDDGCKDVEENGLSCR
jgi:hypothetical protein